MTIDTQAMAWAMRAAGQDLDAGARAELDAWCARDIRHEGAYLRALAILHTVDAAAAEHRNTSRQRGLAARFGAAANARWWRWYLPGALAAGLAAVMVLGWRPAPPPPQAMVVATAIGELRQVALSDRSSASVSSATRIEVVIGADERRVRLAQGEAWFAVARDPGRPFVVEAGPVRVRAVGTAFSVRRDPGATRVLVTEGVVEVWRDGAAGRTRLAAGESARVDAARVTISRQSGAVQRALAWREGKLVFQNDTLDAAAREFNRYNARPIVIADRALAGRTVVGQYRIDGPERFAGDMQAIFKVPVQVTPERIVIGGPAAP